MQNITELRTSLNDNYTKMKDGEMGLKVGKTLANTAGRIINSLQVELEYNALMGIKHKIKYLEVTDKK